MNREPGYYWVKVRGESQEPIEWSAVRCLGDNTWYYGGKLLKLPDNVWTICINEARIPSPEEPMPGSSFASTDVSEYIVGPDGFREYKVGERIYGFCDGMLCNVILKEGDILNKNYRWLTKLQFNLLQFQVCDKNE